MKRVLALCKYGSAAASTRHRIIQFEPALSDAGFQVERAAFFDDRHMDRLVQGRGPSLLTAALGYMHRIKDVMAARRYDAVWVQYEFFPYLPSFFEALATRGSGAPIVVDYDDAVFHRYDENASPLVRSIAQGKLEPLLRGATACTCGNEYVRAYAAQFCDRCVLVPTVVDTSVYRPARTANRTHVVIGWIGSPSTWPNVRPLLPVLRELCQSDGVRVHAVGAGVAAEADRFAGLELIDWSQATEVGEIQKMDIGIMPLKDRPFERGKSGFKLIQYMSCGLPVVASPVGVNCEIVRDGENGFLATSPETWLGFLSRLVADAALRNDFGRVGRLRVESEYSLHSQAPKLVQLFQSIVR